MDEGEGHDDRFEWDDFNLDSAQRHGISWLEIESALDNRPYVDRFGYDESRGEVIYRALGRVPERGQLISVLYVLRERDRVTRIRVFHAMDMKANERRLYRRQRGQRA
ncbi:MAG: BrnT family toxin [Chloroflexota bacterium]